MSALPYGVNVGKPEKLFRTKINHSELQNYHNQPVRTTTWLSISRFAVLEDLVAT